MYIFGGYIFLGVAEEDGHSMLRPTGFTADLDIARFDAIQKEILQQTLDVTYSSQYNI